MGNKKILFFDIDETLISHKTFSIPESTKEAIKKAKEKGHLVIINTKGELLYSASEDGAYFYCSDKSSECYSYKINEAK